jgi:uncharacterized membrane protein
MAPAPPISPPPPDRSLWWLGMILMVGSTVAGAIGGLFIRKSHLIASRHARLSWAYWLVGIFVVQLFLNVGMSMAALAFAAQSLLSPLIACQIVFNAFLAPCFLAGETLTVRDGVGTAFIVAGCVAAGLFAPHSDPHYSLQVLLDDYTRPAFLAYAATCAALMAGAYLGSLQRRWQSLQRVGAAALPGALVGNANIFAKAASGLLVGAVAHGDWSPFAKSPLPYVVMVVAPLMAGLSLLFLNRALAAWPATSIVPTYISTLVVVSTVSGGLCFGEFASLSASHALGLACGVLLVVAGVTVQASGARPEAGGLTSRNGGGGGGGGGGALGSSTDDPSTALREAFCPPADEPGAGPGGWRMGVRAAQRAEERSTERFSFDSAEGASASRRGGPR